MTPDELGTELSHRLGYEPQLVQRITITKTGIILTLYRTNDNDKKHVDEDGKAATYQETTVTCAAHLAEVAS